MDPVRKQRQAEAPRADGVKGRVVLARFGAPHGVRGEIRLKSYTDVPAAVVGYSPLQTTDGRQVRLTAARAAPGGAADMLVVTVEGIGDRNTAEALNGLELSVARDRLPKIAGDDFYHADLVGLAAETPGGEPLGTVAAVHNHGAGDILEIALPDGAPLLVPFTKAAVPLVEIAEGRLVVDPPAGLVDQGGEETI
jgi:16S rRNA processing protein RimM